MGEPNLKRPKGLTIITIIRFICGLTNIYLRFNTIIPVMEALPYIFGPLIASYLFAVSQRTACKNLSWITSAQITNYGTTNN